MIYVFTFLGEFGFELLNWQAVIRKFSATINPGDKIICCSRANLYPLYEYADAFIDVTDVPLFRQSSASGYYALPESNRRWDLTVRAMDRRLKTELKTFIQERLQELGLLSPPTQALHYIFSSDGIKLNGCKFGRTGYRQNLLSAMLSSVIYNLETRLGKQQTLRIRRLKFRLMDRIKPIDHRMDGDIYGQLDIKNNFYKRIEPDLSVATTVATTLGWSLEEPFLLFQGRRRDTSQASDDLLPNQLMPELLSRISQHVKVVLLSFDTQRWLDSYYNFDEVTDHYVYRCQSFPEQACLIHFAAHCIFLTEGDLGSHIYLPPMLGKNVTAIAPGSVYALDSSPIDFWNTNVFTFGGQVLPHQSEIIYRDRSSLDHFVKGILRQYVQAGARFSY